jgi:hypothetical protein
LLLPFLALILVYSIPFVVEFRRNEVVGAWRFADALADGSVAARLHAVAAGGAARLSRVWFSVPRDQGAVSTMTRSPSACSSRSSCWCSAAFLSRGC